MEISILYPLILGLVGITMIAMRKGYKLNDLGRMMYKGSKKSFLVIRIFILIGAITAVWRACGTISFIVYYGTVLISTKYFILSAFILSSLVSFLLGTSFGTVGTIGVVLIVLAKSGNVDINTAAGAIIAGAYFGDRCSPMSSSANLIAVLTNTELYMNIKNMIKTSIIPFALSILCYIILSLNNPLIFRANRIETEILRLFDISIIVLLPAVIILILAACKIDVKISMSLSILLGILIAVFIQHKTFSEILKFIALGYYIDEYGFFANIIQGGGLYSMLKVSLIVLISSAYAGIFEGTGLLNNIEVFCEKLSHKVGLYAGTIVTSIATAAFSCNQTLAVILTNQIQNKIYEKNKVNNYQLALDLENTVIVISALIPWNIAGAVPAATLSADSGFIIYAFYLFLVPLTNFFKLKITN